MHLFKYVLTLGLILSVTTLMAQYEISGTIKDKNTGETLIGVYIYLPDMRIGILSDDNGFYQIKDLKKGSYMLDVSYLGYQSISERVDLEKDTIISFALQSSATELNEIVITGVSRPTESKRNPIVISTIGRNTLAQTTSTNLIDALKEVPGVSEITSGPNISKPVIRGLGYNRIITLNNGIKQEGQQWGDEHGVEIDEYSVDRAEIIKGPGSLLYGSDGIGGVLNFLPPKPPLDGEIKTQVLANYQTNNHLIGYSLMNAGSKNGFQWLGRFSNKYASNYQNKYDGKVLNSAYKEINGNLSLGINKRWGHSILTISSYNTHLGIVEGERDSFGKFTYINSLGKTTTATPTILNSSEIVTPYQIINHISIASNSFIVLKKGSINFDMGFQSNLRREFEEAVMPDNVGLSLRLNTSSYNIRYNLKNYQGWETAVGISGMQQLNLNKGHEFLIPDYQLFDIGAFAFTQKTLKKITLAGGLRFDNRSIAGKALYLNNGIPVAAMGSGDELKFSQFVKNFNGFSGSIGISYQISKASTLKFNFSNGYRAPNIAELASNGVHEGTFRYEMGNLQLKSELSHQMDLAYLLNSEHVTLEISPFINFINHYSFLHKLKDKAGKDIFPDTNENTPAFQYTSGDAMLYGGEIYLDFHPHPLDWLHIENSLSFVRGILQHQTDSTRNLPFIPAPQYRGGLKAEFENLGKHVANFFVKLGFNYTFQQNHIYSAFETETITPGYFLLSAGIGASFNTSTIKDFIQLYISSDNLTNSTYQNHLSRLKYAGENPLTHRIGVYNMGRNISIKMILNI